MDTNDEVSNGNRIAMFVIEKLFLKKLGKRAGGWSLE